jgi:hypothetical protein
MNDAINDASTSWTELLAAAAKDIEAITLPGEPFILVDNNQMAANIFSNRTRIPFLEKDGKYWGEPINDIAALREIERHKKEGIRYIIFIWTSFWWKNNYCKFWDYLQHNYCCSLKNDRIICFDLKQKPRRSFKTLIRTIEHLYLRNLSYTLYKFFAGSGYKRIPIIINNRNRYEYLMQLLSSLETRGYTNIYILDNNSSYPLSLEYYKKTKHKVIQLNENVGHLAIWESGVWEKMFKNSFYVYTDPDIAPIYECPADFMNYFRFLLYKYKSIDKVGFGLKIDDLPDHYAQKAKVISWEKQHFDTVVKQNLYEAPIDTTFALYRQGKKGDWRLNAYRTGGKLMARHLPWYEDSVNPREEVIYYIKHSYTSTHWTQIEVDKESS